MAELSTPDASGFGFTVHPTFEELPTPVGGRLYVQTSRIKGVLMDCVVPALPGIPGTPEDPEIAMHFLHTDLDMQHGELLHKSAYPYGYTTQPEHVVVPRNRPYSVAVRYTQWKDAGGGLELAVMLDRTGGKVQEGAFYPLLLRTVAVASACAILDPHWRGDDGTITLTVANNFRRLQMLASEPYEAASIGDLYRQLSTS